MRRRDFITGIAGSAAAWPLAARAQRPLMPVIGYLSFLSSFDHAPRSNSFRAGLRDLGYAEGKNVKIEYRYAEGDNDRLLGLATELVRMNVDVIVTYATGVPAARRATATIPIVMVAYTDPVATGLVASLANPGGNVTGSTFFNPELMAKRLEFLKEVVPSMTQAGVFLFRGSPVNGHILEVMGGTAKALRVGLQAFEINKPTEFESAFSALANKQIGALVVTDHTRFFSPTPV